MADNLLLIFVKYPAPGQVKSRLAATLGDRQASQVYKNLTEQLISEVIQSSEDTDYAMIIAYSPADAARDMQAWLGSGIQLIPQTGANLGERMHNAFAQGFSRGYKKIVIIGSDCPAVTRELISDALNKLDSHEVVIGPAADGGYYLLGLRQAVPELFEKIAWSTDRVLKQTIKLCSTQGLSPALLSEMRDIDRIEDLAYYREQGMLF